MRPDLMELAERWPGYNEQSWQQRFAELDRRYAEMQSEIAKRLRPPAPIYDAMAKCGVCGIDFGKGAVGYCCPRMDCPRQPSVTSALSETPHVE